MSEYSIRNDLNWKKVKLPKSSIRREFKYGSHKNITI